MFRRISPILRTARPLTVARKVNPVRKGASTGTSAAPALKASTSASSGNGSTVGSDGQTDPMSVSLNDSPILSTTEGHGPSHIDWSGSFHGLGLQPFSKEASNVLLAPLANEDIEIKPDGLLYLPEIKYRRILNRAFGPGGWGLAPRTETLITPKQVSREYGLICNGRLVSVSRGEQDYFGGAEKLTTALEGSKSNALMRCCKDLGIASELWDPAFVRLWKRKHCEEVFGEHVLTKKKRKLWKLKTNTLEYPYKAC